MAKAADQKTKQEKSTLLESSLAELTDTASRRVGKDIVLDAAAPHVSLGQRKSMDGQNYLQSPVSQEAGTTSFVDRSSEGTLKDMDEREKGLAELIKEWEDERKELARLVKALEDSEKELAELVEAREKLAKLEKELAELEREPDEVPQPSPNPFLVISRFLYTAARQRQTEHLSEKEGAACEDLLLMLYGGDETAVQAMQKLCDGVDEEIPYPTGVLIPVYRRLITCGSILLFTHLGRVSNIDY